MYNPQDIFHHNEERYSVLNKHNLVCSGCGVYLRILIQKEFPSLSITESVFILLYLDYVELVAKHIVMEI